MLDVLRFAYISETTGDDTVTLLSSDCHAKVHYNLVLSIADFETALIQARRENPVWEILLMSLYKTADSSAAQNALLRDTAFMQMFLEKQTKYIEEKMNTEEESVVSYEENDMTEQSNPVENLNEVGTEDTPTTSFDTADILAMAMSDSNDNDSISSGFSCGDPFADSLECVSTPEPEAEPETETETESEPESEIKSEFKSEPESEPTPNKEDYSELRGTLSTVFETAETLAKDSNVFMAVREKVAEQNLLKSFVDAYEVALQECATKEERCTLLTGVIKVMMLDPRTASTSFVKLTKDLSYRLIDKHPTLAEAAVMPLVEAIYTGTDDE